MVWGCTVTGSKMSITWVLLSGVNRGCVCPVSGCYITDIQRIWSTYYITHNLSYYDSL